MYIAKNKRKENIAEYILYLWQLEDLLRALQFSPEAVYNTLVKPRGLERAAEEELLEWYMGVIELLEKEDKTEHGHLDHTLHLIADLHDLHLELLKIPAGKCYREVYATVAPELPRLRKALKAGEVSDTELLFRALYAVMLYRIKGDEDAHKAFIKDVLEVVSPLVAELAAIYRGAEQGEIDLAAGE
ncbi:MAG: DUF4924 family protein [Rikenellaceae bacterium]|jgi:hypothetical protein|nr:DUF4924 family protein [Rikenellaceae bacterium]